MKKISKDVAHAIAIGKFYRIAGNYAESFKIGGYQKLQKIIGEDLIYKKDYGWWWNNPKITHMTTIQLTALQKKVEDALNKRIKKTN